MSLRRTWLDRGSRERVTAVEVSAVVMVEVAAQTWRETRKRPASSDLAKSLHPVWESDFILQVRSEGLVVKNELKRRPPRRHKFEAKNGQIDRLREPPLFAPSARSS